ncbi:unnamed protein product [Lepeophtheirus salmonis]|uniref:(salmon louse) hypothetical protein n=1 Tax=Lepeophtheirus salmonis TaxID=72036 RepID=A0A7R8CWG7_LEPSM|nr:unnamed protein product [Lepeophtheirus salmonis]CAF2952199.1 unnamed protein product [Lepeophtheirus salmonis]
MSFCICILLAVSGSEKLFSDRARSICYHVWPVKVREISIRSSFYHQDSPQGLGVHLESETKELPQVVTARLARFTVQLSMFNFKIKLVEGAEISHANAFSRGPFDEPLTVGDEVDMVMCNLLTDSGSCGEDILKAYDNDKKTTSSHECCKVKSLPQEEELFMYQE